MRVHHLNCATLRPPLRRLVNGTGKLFEAGTMVCHCLLVETDEGLVLVDSGLGTADVRDPVGSLGGRFVRLTRPRADLRETARHQVTELGYRPEDVRHIVLTHLDLDHAGGIVDFPWARVHVHARELAAATRPSTGKEKTGRYRPNHWAHGPDWVTYPDTSGDTWFDLPAVRQLDGLPPEILLVPLPGHTRGHTGVAVDTGPTWLLHAGDAYFFHGESDPVRPHSTAAMWAFQRLMQVDGTARRDSAAMLRRLRGAHGDRVEVFSAHDAVELARYDRSAPTAAR
ncbi:MBL fold metallo-hydrolase [Micromonospora zhanjiangensis]|uniref:MBL fold metallo-hydrolase n=1 Tax=Micromonospora zhanjiangensis TaxID=1522057 RepID=A0ABV8KQ01_9ACTN